MNNYNRRMWKVGCPFRQRTDSVFCFKLLQWQQVVGKEHPLVGKRFTLEFMAPGY